MNSRLRKVAHRKAQLQNRVWCFPNRKNFENFRIIQNKTTSIRRKAAKDFLSDNCSKHCRNIPNYYKAIKSFMCRKGGSNVVPIQFMEGDTLVTKPVELATLYNDCCVNITRCIGQPTADTSYMSDAEFVGYSVVKYQDHSSIKHISDCMGKSEVPITFNFIEVSIDGVNKILNKVNPKKATGYDQIHSDKEVIQHFLLSSYVEGSQNPYLETQSGGISSNEISPMQHFFVIFVIICLHLIPC